MCRLLSKTVIKDTKQNRIKNDCPSQCDRTHCDVCQFTDNKKVVTVRNPSPEIYGREMYYQVVKPKKEISRSILLMTLD